MQINITNIVESDIYIEIQIVERSRLLNYELIGIRKGEKDDLEPKIGLYKDRVLTENMKLSAVEAFWIVAASGVSPSSNTPSLRRADVIIWSREIVNEELDIIILKYV